MNFSQRTLFYTTTQIRVNIEAAKVSPLSTGKVDNYELRTDEEKLPSNESRIIEEAPSTCYSLSKAIEKQIKAIEDQGIKQVEV